MNSIIKSFSFEFGGHKRNKTSNCCCDYRVANDINSFRHKNNHPPKRFQVLFHSYERRKRNRRNNTCTCTARNQEENNAIIDSNIQDMENLILEVHHDRSLAIKLRQVGNIDGVEIVHTSSNTLSTIHESNYFNNGYAGGIYVSDDDEDDDDDEELTVKNKLRDSLPSLVWEETVDRIICKQRKRQTNLTTDACPYSSTLLKNTFDRRCGQETRDEAFEQLQVLDDIANYLTEEREPCDEQECERESEDATTTYTESDEREAEVLGARGSQLRRRLFKIQRDSDVLIPMARYSS